MIPEDARPGTHPGELREAPVKDWAIRFAFGAGVSALAGIVAKVFGPQFGGLFLAFPAILLASLTLVAKEEGADRARDDARGAFLGALGLIGFALAVWATTPRWPIVVSLIAGVLAWAAISAIAYFGSWRRAETTTRRPGQPQAQSGTVCRDGRER